MKICHVITRLILGGAQENTLITCRLLAERGHEVTLITGPAYGPEGELFEQARKEPYRIITVDELVRPIRPVKDILGYFKLKKLLRELRPDVVHTHSAKAGIIGRYAGDSVKGFWADDRPAVVHTIHGLAFHPYQSGLLNKFYVAIEKATARKTDYFISVADAMSEQAKAAGIGRDKPFVTAYSAIDEGAFLAEPSNEVKQEFRGRFGIPEDAVVFVTVARLFELKGHDYIIESAKKLAAESEKAYWLFVGDGNLNETYRKQIAESGLSDRFRFTGLVPPSEVPLAIHASDVLVHCSLREGLARALPQAMLCGKPAVSFDVDGAREVVNAETGRLIEPKNVTQLTQVCHELLEDGELHERLGRQAREQVRQKFAPETMVDIIESVYRDALGRQ